MNENKFNFEKEFLREFKDTFFISGHQAVSMSREVAVLIRVIQRAYDRQVAIHESALQNKAAAESVI